MVEPVDAARIAALLDRYVAAAQCGDAPDREAFLAAHPDVAQELRQALLALEFIDRLDVLGDVGEGEGGLLGDFRIFAEIGRGGMGVVYEAEQISLGRRVALKVLPFAAVLDRQQLQRFKNEAQAAAHLHHTHIVPVYSVGQERGVHYYAMQHIQGLTLAQVVQEVRAVEGRNGNGRPANFSSSAPLRAITGGASSRSTAYCRTVSRLGIQAAEALNHAHEQGVVHRDIKPANLIVDEDGHLWITDFGLASFAGNPGLTMTGDFMGTVRYMSPEQVRRERAPGDPRMDVYALGATLYELLTLQPPHAGTQVQALLRDIAEVEPAPARRLNPAVPAELETILLKAMAKAMAERYATAQDLADDLRRFLEHKPIRATRPTLAQRAGKWAQRHTALVWSAAAVLLLTMAALVFTTARVAHEQDETAAALGEAQRQEARAKADRRRAMAAVDEMLTAVAQTDLAQVPQTEELRLELLRKALAFYRDFLSDAGEDPGAAAEVGRACIRVADIVSMPLMRKAESEPLFAEAIGIFAKLVEQYPEDHEYRYQLARGHGKFSIALMQRDIGRAEALTRRALAAAERLVAEVPDEAKYQTLLCNAHNCLGWMLNDQGRLREAEAHFRRCVELGPGPLPRSNLAGVLWKMNRLEEAERVLRAGLAEYSPPRRNIELGLLHYNLACVLADGGRSAEAQLTFDEVISIFREISERSPARPSPRWMWARGLLGRATLLRETQPAAAETDTRRGIELAEGLVEEWPDNPDFACTFARLMVNLGRLLSQSDPAAARAVSDAARLRLVGLVAKHPRQVEHALALAEALAHRGEHLRDSGDPSGSLTSLAEAIGLIGEVLEQWPEEGRAHVLHMDLHTSLGATHAELQNYADAQRALRTALVLSRRLVSEHPEEAWCRSRLAAACNRLAHRLAADPTEHRAPAEAVELAREAVQLAAQDADPRRTLGVAHYRAGSWKDAVSALERSMALRNGGDAHDWFLLAMARWRLEQREKARRWFDKAVAWTDEKAKDDPELARIRAEAGGLLGVDEDD